MDKHLKGHVVVVGCGRIGIQTARVLQRLEVPFVMIELDQRRLEKAKDAGIPIIFGDAAQEVVQKAARVAQASLLLITTPGLVVAHGVMQQARRLQEGLTIVVRATELAHVRELKEAGAAGVIHAEFEAGLEFMRQSLSHLRMPLATIERYADLLRQEMYAPFHRDALPDTILAHLPGVDIELEWVEITGTSPLLALSLRDGHIRETTGATVVGVLRDGELITNPEPEFRFGHQDRVAIIGAPGACGAFRRMAEAVS